MISRIALLAILTTLLPFGALAAVPATPAAPVPRPAARNFTETVSIHRHVATGLPNTNTEIAVKFEMVYIPAGEFTMGSPDDEPGRDGNEGPRHRVWVGSFWLGKCEVTWDEFNLFQHDEKYPREGERRNAKAGPDAVTRPSATYVDETYDHGREGHPALCMTHHAAMMYCHWLRQKTKRDYRLPTEAEWEYAARAGKGDSAYYFGNDPKSLGDFAWFKDNSIDPENFPDKPKGCTHKVGKQKANPFGLHDMYGNVAEWTLDQFDAKAYSKRAEKKLSIRPVTVPTTEKWSHVARGGSWADKSEKVRSSARRVSDVSWQKHEPQEPKPLWWLTRLDVIGFRVALPAEEQPELVGLMPKAVLKDGQ